MARRASWSVFADRRPWVQVTPIAMARGERRSPTNRMGPAGVPATLRVAGLSRAPPEPPGADSRPGRGGLIWRFVGADVPRAGSINNRRDLRDVVPLAATHQTCPV